VRRSATRKARSEIKIGNEGRDERQSPIRQQESRAARTERGQADPCPTDEDHRPLSERVRGLAATLVPGLMQQRSLRHDLQVESLHLLCSDQLHCRPYFQRVACRMLVDGRRQDRPGKFRLLHGIPNPSAMRARWRRVPPRVGGEARLCIFGRICRRCGDCAQADLPKV
jgi:hypothetical protein